MTAAAAAIFVLLALAIWLLLMREFRLDDAFITYRYARNVVRGLGLVYNPGQITLSTTAPLYALLLAGARATAGAGLDFHTLGGLIGAVCIGLGGGVITALLPERVPPRARLWAGAAYTLATPLWLALGMETPLWILLALTGLERAAADRWGWAGLWIGLGILTRPDAALPGLLIGLWAALAALDRAGTRSGWWRPPVCFAIGAALPVALFYGWAWATYGSPFPATFDAKRAQAEMGITGFGVGTTTLEGLGLIAGGLLEQSGLYLLFGGLAFAGLLWGRPVGPVAVAVLWGALHVLIYAILGVAPYRWYYAPLVPGILLLAALGLARLSDVLARWRRRRSRGRWTRALPAGVATLALLAPAMSFARIAAYFASGGPPGPMLPIVDWAAYREAGEWIAAHTPPDATVGVAEVGQIGFYADRPMTDYLGLLQPETAEALERGDIASWLPANAPATLVFQGFRGRPPVLYNVRLDTDPWFAASYAPAATFDDPRYAYGPVTVYRRTAEARPLVETATDLTFGPLRLVGLATDAADLPAGGPIRVRLDWEVARPEELPERLRIVLSIPEAGDTPNADREIAPGGAGGRFSTWHTLVLDEALPPGGYRLLVSAGPAGAPDYAVAPGGWVDISFPRAGAPLRAEPVFSADGAPLIALARAASVTAAGRTLMLDLAWRALADIGRDYTLFVHLRPVDDPLPAVQADGMPRGGTYPTHLWQVGEVVPDTIALEAPAAPGAYELAIGWYAAPDGPRLTLTDGADAAHPADALRLARIIVEQDGSLRVAASS